jgi:hypothetical protein
MTRKLTARKHIHAPPQRNVMPTESHSDGQRAGYFPRTLRTLFLAQGYSEPPLLSLSRGCFTGTHTFACVWSSTRGLRPIIFAASTTWSRLPHRCCWHFICSSTSALNYQCSTSPRVFSRYHIYIFPREEGSLSCLRLTQGVIPMSTPRLYRGYVNWG